MVKAGTGLKSGGAEAAPPGGGERAGLSASRAVANPIPAPQRAGERKPEPGACTVSSSGCASGQIGWSSDTSRRRFGGRGGGVKHEPPATWGILAAGEAAPLPAHIAPRAAATPL